MQRELKALIAATSECRSIARALAPLDAVPALLRESLGPILNADSRCTIPRVTFRGPNSSDPIRIGIFAAIHGDEPAGALALVQF